MNKIKKLITCIVSLACVAAFAVGCSSSSSMSYTFSVDNGDSIKVSLDTSDKYKITSDVPFTISHDGEDLSQGTFIQSDAYEQYTNVVETDEKAVLLDSGTKDGNDYVFWCYDGKEYNYAIKIADSNTGMILGNPVSEEAAKECFNRLTITKE